MTNFRLFAIIISVIVLSLFFLATFPEPGTNHLISLHNIDATLIHAKNSCMSISSYPQQFSHIRDSSGNFPESSICRTFNPETGISPVGFKSSNFKPKQYMSVAITGSTKSQLGLVTAFIECIDNQRTIPLFNGSVNNHLNESIVFMPNDWCPNEAMLKFHSDEVGHYAGIGSVYEITFLSFLKSSFIGILPYFITAFAIFSFVMFAGSSLATRIAGHHDPLPLAFISLGSASLGGFYLGSGLPDNWQWLSIVVVLAASASALYSAGFAARCQTAHQLMPYARVWAVASLIYFSILCLAYNGLGHWEPNYRFWPATWSSDNELPWMFAEAIRHGWDLKGLFGGGWLPTDRPPLMAGAYLLLIDVFGLLQSNNDGSYLRGPAYNAAAVVLNALWVPAVWWLLKTLSERLNDNGRMAVLVFVACTPFILFNTVYGWPKAFGAAFALLSFGLAWQSHQLALIDSKNSTTLLFFVLGAFSMLAHSSTALFLAPLGMLFVFWNLRSNTRLVLIGFAVALALLASWSLYKWVVLPSADPVTKYALTGDYGFGHHKSFWQMLTDRYREMSFWQWLEIKRIMLLQVFLPLHNPVTQIGLNSDYGSGAIDKLRAWDFMLLSKGNVATVLFAIVSAWISLSTFTFRKSDASQHQGPFLVLVGISVVAWLLIVLGFLVPPVLHIWPQAAVFGLALGGAVVTCQYYPLLFSLTLIALMTYTGTVWIISPLQSALLIDPGAALVLAALLSWGLISKFLPLPLSHEK